ncbi:MAG: CoA pyrophosphatase [Flavobacteriaceae bacterium]|nr:CoA pyrophosphatase [Bacteroidia bacterium]NNK82925.1 CoA pyrophosphatase [Flavobacteriaceae bacterium]
MNFKAFLNLISKIENIELPAQDSQFKMSPPFRNELIKKYSEEMKSAKRAGVLALFYPNNSNITYLVLILRKTYQGIHSNQVGFPGGKIEDKDSNLKETAIRETYEEIGVEQPKVEVLKRLTEVYIPPSNYFVQPFMGICKTTPKFTKQDDEVEDIIEIPLHEFLDNKAVITSKVNTSYSITVEVPAFKLNGHIVWGATAMMLSEIKDLLKQMLK